MKSQSVTVLKINKLLHPPHPLPHGGQGCYFFKNAVGLVSRHSIGGLKRTHALVDKSRPSVRVMPCGLLT